MRILHVLFSSRIAGSERYCIDLANRQAAAGHDVHVAGMRSAPLQGALSTQVRYHPFSWFFRSLFLHRLVTRLAPDICHGHLSAACKALKGVRRHQQTVATLHVGYKPHQHAWLDGLICVNRTQAGRLDGYRGMARTIPNWLPIAPHRNQGQGIREELGLGNGVFLVGAVGRLHASKGMDLLIAAFQAGAPANAALVIVGEDPQRAELEKLRAGDPRIHLIGYRADVYPCLHELDLFVSPSREESFGLAIIEAMSTGLPVIATAADGPGEYLCDQPVTLVPLGSREALATGIAAACRQYQSGGLPRIGYDLSLFDSAARVSDIIDFDDQVIAAGHWNASLRESPGRGRRHHMIRPPATDFWQVGLVPAPIASLLDPAALAAVRERIVWLPDPGPWCYLADPFALRRGDATHVFVEAFDYRTKHGVIEHHEFGPGLVWREKQTALTRMFHLSYPFLVEHAGEVFMIPESQRYGEIALYRARKFPGGWAREATLLQNVPGAEASVIQHKGTWWMFFTVVGPKARDQRELHVASAPQLTGPWQLHPRNPVLVDRTGARPGGTPFVGPDGRVILPVQDCSRTYGGAIRFLRFNTLGPDRIETEHVAGTLNGGLASDSHRDGLHTVAACGDLTLIDTKRIVHPWGRYVIDLRRRTKRMVSV